MFDVKPFNVGNYPAYKDWLLARGRQTPPYEDLPAWGSVVYLNNVPICAGFIYKTDSTMCPIGNLASDGSKSNKIRGAAVDCLIDQLMIDAKELGYKMAVFTTSKRKMLDRLYDRGFEMFDENLVQVGRVL